MTHLKPWLKAISINIANVTAFYLWKAYDIEQAGNVLLFWLWLIAIMSCLFLFAPASLKQITPRNKSLDTFNRVCALLTISTLAGFAHYALALFYFIGCLSFAGFRSKYDDEGNLLPKENQ